ncbi:MAG TPA: toll/interleukin-1 receptor domain-containing protein [Chitinophagaceae bacterium]|nr:toll/interleukin-1 receptor domain-containing protein [Chitinophagaceae bacterium]
MDIEYKYDVAISFADEDKDAAKSLALAFEAVDVNAYYYDDVDERIISLGHDLEKRLTEIYKNEARYAIILFSENYFAINKRYTRIELAAILDRMQTDTDKVYMLPIKFKDDFIIKEYPELNTLTYAVWDSRPELVAAGIKKLLGKKLTKKNKATDGLAFLYSGGNDPKIIIANEYIDINTDIFKNSETGDVIINISANNSSNFSGGDNAQQVSTVNPGGNIIQNRGDGGIIVAVNMGQEDQGVNINEDDTVFPCSKCNTLLDIKGYGKIICPNCGKPSFKRNYNPVVKDFNTIDDQKEQSRYKKILWHINNKLKDGNYFLAHKYCMQAEEIAPGESATWESFALTEFLIEINTRERTKPIQEIVRRVKNHLIKCKMYGIEQSRYEEVSGDIANRLFNFLKKQINKFHPQKGSVYPAVQFIKGYESCYNLYPDSQFLEAYVYELSKPYKWIVRQRNGKLTNLSSCGNFPAVMNREKIINRIVNEINIEYKPPDISMERFIIITEIMITDITKP